MDPIAAAAALVGGMATDAWQQARAALAVWWRRARPERAGAVSAELETMRARVLAVRGRGR